MDVADLLTHIDLFEMHTRTRVSITREYQREHGVLPSRVNELARGSFSLGFRLNVYCGIPSNGFQSELSDVIPVIPRMMYHIYQ